MTVFLCCPLDLGGKHMLTFRRNSALTALLVPALLTVTAAPIRPWTTASPVDCTWETQGEHNILLPAVALVAPKHRGNAQQTCICHRKVLTALQTRDSHRQGTWKGFPGMSPEHWNSLTKRAPTCQFIKNHIIIY